MRKKVRIADLISFSLESLGRHRSRTMMTIIGVLIGTCSIVLMVSMSIAVDTNTQEMLKSYGSLTEINILSMPDSKTAPTITDETLKEIKELPNITAATPFYIPRINAHIYSGEDNRYESPFDIIGLYPSAMKPLEYSLISGNYLPDAPSGLNNGKIPILIPEGYGFQFQDTKKSMGNPDRYASQKMNSKGNMEGTPFVDIQKDRLKLIVSSDDSKNLETITFELIIVGVLKTDYARGIGTSIIMDVADLKTLENRYNRLNKENSFSISEKYVDAVVKVSDIKYVQQIQSNLNEMGYQTRSLDSVREEMQASARQSQIILGGLGLITLVIAAIGISNTMTMNIHERKKEIGVLKVLGCRTKHLKMIFLFESGTMGFFGGIGGALISYVISYIFNTANYWIASLNQANAEEITNETVSLAKQSIIPFWLVVLAVCFATVIGLVAGIIPSNKVAKISPLEAIRYG